MLKRLLLFIGCLLLIGLQVGCVIHTYAQPLKTALNQGVISLNLGGRFLTASDGRRFTADACKVTEGSLSQCRRMATVKGSQDPELFVSYREGPQSYAFDLPKGSYAVTLHFAEPELQDLVPRQFQVELQGQLVLPDFDVKANRDGHGQAALSRTLLTEVAEGEQLVLRLVPLRGLPILSGIEVLPISQSSTLDKGALIWSDEFDDGAESPVQSPSIDRWQYDIWPAGKVNSEDQTYTDRLKNVRVEAGHLVIEAHREALAGAAYTSGRIHTKDRLDVRYGVIEVKAKLPEGQGTWPAIWMLPSDAFKFATTCDASVGEWQGNGACDAWPNSGEIDIMEHVGFDPGVVHGTVHSKAYYWAKWNQHKGSVLVTNFTEFHRYQLIWTADKLVWLIDDIPYFSYVREGNDWESWPFNEPFHLILNLAVGGNWGRAGGPIDDDSLPARFEVDYVRVYALPDSQAVEKDERSQ